MRRVEDLAKADGAQILATAIARWLPGQRWFAGKARTIAGLTVADTAVLGHGVIDVIAEVRYADGGHERYQIPLVGRQSDGQGVVARLPDFLLVDALTDPAACRVLAARTATKRLTKTAEGSAVDGQPVTGEEPGRDEPVRPLGVEQSNSSVVIGDRLILKVFRRLEAGPQPDVEIPAALTAAGSPFVPAVHGTLVLRPNTGEPTSLMVLSDFLSEAREGWALALDELAGLRPGELSGLQPGGDPSERRLANAATDLGKALAGLHQVMAACLGSRAAGAADARGWADDLRAQAERVLAAVHEDGPAGALRARRAEILELLAVAGQIAEPGLVCRIHGDLHLQQVLLDSDGGWRFLDFEGEPARSLEARRALASPLRDVAGMLRSFDYVAAMSSHADGGPVSAAKDEHERAARARAAEAWRDMMRDRFLGGYLPAARNSGLLSADERTVAMLLRVFELDKAVYELGYELANRPGWVPIPVGGIVRVLDQGPAGTAPGAPEPTTGIAVGRTDTKNWRADPAAVTELLRGTLHEPHRLMGAHATGDGGVVRTYRPEAEAVEVVLDTGEAFPAVETHDAGFFEARLPQQPAAAAYRLRVRYPGDATFSLRDPYAFWPTLGEVDLHLAGEGRHEELWRRMGAHVTAVDGVVGTAFAVWAPNAKGVRVVGDFNSWDGRLHPMRLLGSSGIWELFLPETVEGAYYKFEIVTAKGELVTRADPYAFATEVPPGTASRVHKSDYQWGDEAWLRERREGTPLASPISVYEVHLGSWRRTPDDGPLSYRDLAHQLADHVSELGFTHVEFLPVAEHPFGGSWGYQVTGYFAPTARFGDPDDFRYLVDHLHQRGIGVIVDWVPAHFPRDDWALARFDGTALYEHLDPRKGEHPDWGTLVFNFGRNEVRNFLVANALFWLEELHVDGLRVDAVASMLYLDYSRQHGQWVPNVYGGRENLEAVEFLMELNRVVYGRNPDVLMIAEESTAWPGVSRPTHLGGLGFGFKWNMGWMHDTLSYFGRDPVYRRFHHNELSFGLMYAWSEHFILPLSHDEVVHGKRSLVDKMPGDRWQKFANLRALYGYMWAHPGKQLLFMGGEFGQWREWSEQRSLDWHLLAEDDHAGLQRLVADLNRVYRGEPALWERDSDPGGFEWIDANDADNNLLSFVRWNTDRGQPVVCLANYAPVPRYGVRIGMPYVGRYREILNTDAGLYGGGNVGNLGEIEAVAEPWHGMPASAEVSLPPLGTIWLAAV